MKFAIAAILGLASFTLAQAPLECPTATKSTQNRRCSKTCEFADCGFLTTIRNPCGCPAAIPTATLQLPCEADCPYGGCSIEFRTTALACPTTSSSSSTRRRRTSTTTTPTPTPTSSSSTKIVTGITTLPPIIRSTPCPVVTKTTSPADCPAIRCPVPTCISRTTLAIPCNCNPKTLLYVQGCQSTCPGGCLTRTETISQVNC
ncbi:hypothetical protein B0H63DRAFT_551003 [Podospora didyma]|uniref:Extracellular membrane protein CFEM domain-containing protein n=1 Tax=Podospora didyma TaxID=330526 RepID=A0AAE0N6V1_9PEZI|nr:hypothetical protein B0H63DRAFT_551003 [Podospora didyma]